MLKYTLIPLVCALVAACASNPESNATNSVCASKDATNKCSAKSEYDVAAIVWPAYHPEPRWKELGIFPHGTGEWQNVYEAKPKFAGHKQPIVPMWGYENTRCAYKKYPRGELPNRLAVCYNTAIS